MTCTHVAAVLVSSVALTAYVAAEPEWVDELPLDDWIEKANHIGSVALRYRLVSATGDEAIFDVAFDTPQRARLVVELEGMRSRWDIDEGVLTQIREPENGPATFVTFDINDHKEEPSAWFRKTSVALDLPEYALPAPRALFSIRAAAEEGRTWSLDLRCGFTEAPPFGWLVMLQDETYSAEAIDDVFVVLLESGIELTLGADDGILRRAVIDADDESAGLVELVHFETDHDFDAEPFVYTISSDAIEASAESLIRPLERSIWRAFRGRSIQMVLDGEAEGAGRLEGQRDVLLERFGALYVGTFRGRVDDAVDRLGASLDEKLDSLRTWFEANRETEGIRQKLADVKDEFGKRLRQECARGARAIARPLVVPPFESDDSTLDDFLELELEAATGAIESELIEPMLAKLDECFAEMDADDDSEAAFSGRAQRLWRVCVAVSFN